MVGWLVSNVGSLSIFTSAQPSKPKKGAVAGLQPNHPCPTVESIYGQGVTADYTFNCGREEEGWERKGKTEWDPK